MLIPIKSLTRPANHLWQHAQSLWQRGYTLLLPPTDSADYRAWQHQFLLQRLLFGLRLAIPIYITLAAYNVYVILFTQSWTLVVQATGQSVETIQRLTLASLPLGISGLIACWIMLRSRWGQQHPVWIFLMFYAVLGGLLDEMVGLFFRIPTGPNPLIFLALALIIPVNWRLHLLAQAIPTLVYMVVYPLLGITQSGDYYSIYNSLGVGQLLELSWVGVCSILAVRWYEQLKRSEFESQRQLQVFLYSVSHDLQTPAMGTSMLLKSLLKDPQEHITLHRSVLEGLQEGSDRQSVLIESLLDAHRADLQSTQLHRQALQIGTLVESLLLNLKPMLVQHEVQLINRIQPDLPLVDGDADQLWRVFSNLITNAMKHNPNRIQITLDADVIDVPMNTLGDSPRMLQCLVQDNGVGITLPQKQKLFERYSRGSRARYMPGLGLGLYICRMIVQAHGGEIEVQSQPGNGTVFRFTLPLV
jgi:signal transduction histidine kinase